MRSREQNTLEAIYEAVVDSAKTVKLDTGESAVLISTKKAEGKRWTEFTLKKDFVAGQGEFARSYKKGEVFDIDGEVDDLVLPSRHGANFETVPEDFYTRKMYIRVQEISVYELV